MEDVYVIRVKSKPPLSSLYPSERRYSASTVGGLALVHFVLGVLALLLGTLAQSLQGPILFLACLVPLTSGLLAWRKWYRDRNISIFFYGCLFSLVASTLCSAVTILDLSAAAENGSVAAWGLEDIFTQPGEFEQPEKKHQKNSSISEEPSVYDVKHIESSDLDPNQTGEGNPLQNKPEAYDGMKTGTVIHNEAEEGITRIQDEVLLSKLVQDESVNITDINAELSEFTIKSNQSVTDFGTPHKDRNDLDSDSMNNESRNRTSDFFPKNIVSWNADLTATPQTRLLLNINVLVACVLEILWSLLSVKISLRGMRNKLPESRYQNNVDPAKSRVKVGLGTKSSRDSRPDILNHNGFNDGSLRSLQSCEPRLPMPESNKEFRERVERFLANQAAHKVVEGSC